MNSVDIDDFIKRYTGVKNVGNTTANKGQCVGLVAVLIDEYGLTHVWGDAKDLYDNASAKEWDKFLNTANALPIKGDILVWNGNSNSSVGHTAIFFQGNLNDFTSFDQNYPTGSTPHLQYHNYNNLRGWIRPKGFTTINPCDEVKKELSEMRSNRNEWRSKVKSLQDNNNELQGKIDGLEVKIKQLEDTINTNVTPLDTKNKNNVYVYSRVGLITEFLERFIRR